MDKQQIWFEMLKFTFKWVIEIERGLELKKKKIAYNEQN